MAGGSRKGSPLERETSEELSLWFSEGKDRDIFWRTQGSGGRATSRGKNKQSAKLSNQYGDITYQKDVGKPFIDFFLIECKRGYSKSISVLELLDSKKSDKKLLSFWEKALLECSEAGRSFPILIFRRDYKKKMIVVPFKLFSRLEDFCGEYSQDLIEYQFQSEKRDSDFVIVDFYKFFEWFNVNTFFLLHKDKAKI